MRDFLANWGPVVAQDAGDAKPPDFTAQCEALLEAQAEVAASVESGASTVEVPCVKTRTAATMPWPSTTSPLRPRRYVPTGSRAAGGID